MFDMSVFFFFLLFLFLNPGYRECQSSVSQIHLSPEIRVQLSFAMTKSARRNRSHLHAPQSDCDTVNRRRRAEAARRSHPTLTEEMNSVAQDQDRLSHKSPWRLETTRLCLLPSRKKKKKDFTERRDLVTPPL